MWLSITFSLLFLFAAHVTPISIVPGSLRTQGLLIPNGLSTKTPRLSWLLSSNTRGDTQTAFQIQVATSNDQLAAPNLWDTGKVLSAHNTVYYSGTALSSRTIAWWRVRVYDVNGSISGWSAVTTFEMGLLESSDWSASWIGNTAYSTGKNSLPIFATSFSVSCPVTQSRLYLLGLGQHSATLNGALVSSAVLEPGYSTYAKTLQYSSYNTTAMVAQGTNLLAIELGKGIYDPEPALNGRYMKFTTAPVQLMLIAQLEYTCLNGTTITVVSDTSWYTTLNGPRIESSWYGGEEYDARKTIPGYPYVLTNLTGWTSPTVTSPPAGALVGASIPALRVVETISPVSVKQVGEQWVFDFGVNFAGWYTLTIDATAGTRVVVYPSERLTSAGLADQSTTGSPIFDGYTSNGTVNTYSPKFMYHGFRYIQVNLTNAPNTASATGFAIRSEVESVGTVSSSVDLFNNIHTFIDRSIQSNTFSTMTDCPHREKLGWLEESHLVIDPVIFSYDMESHLRKVVDDICDSQTSSGLVPDISPEFVVFSGGFRDDPNWGTTSIILPLKHFLNYGDVTVLSGAYNTMQSYMDYLATLTGDSYLLAYGLGDWETLDNSTYVGVTATYAYAIAAAAMIDISGYLGNSSEAFKYTTLLDNIIDAFNTAWFNSSNNTYMSGTQADFALALDMGAVNSTETYMAVAENLVSAVSKEGYWTSGEISLPALFRSLQNSGNNELLFTLMSSQTYPSYGYEIAQGATSLWEQWDGGSGSLNHFMFGYGDNWLRTLSGLQQAPGSVAWADILYKPVIVGNMTSASATYRSIKGAANAAWSMSGFILTYTITVPVLSKGQVVLGYRSILENGAAIVSGENGIISISTNGNITTINVESGTFVFTAQ